MGTGLIEALAVAAREAREEKGVSKEELAVALQQAGSSGSVDKVRRFERGDAFQALNDLVEAYEEAVGLSLFDLLDDTKAILKKNG